MRDRSHLRLVKPSPGPSLDILRGFRQIYLCTPYTSHSSGDLEQAYHDTNILLCRLRARDLHNVYSPIAHWHGAAVAGDLPTDHDSWKDDNERKMLASDAIAVATIPGWDKPANGVHWERGLAKDLGRPIYFLNHETLSVSI